MISLKNILPILVLYVCCSNSILTAQETKKSSENEFTLLEGKPKVRVFSDFTHGMFKNNEVSEFNIKRAVFGYEAKFGHGLSADLEIDFASTEKPDPYSGGEVEYATYVRNAELQWNVNNFQLNFGVITPMIFNYAERFWGYRYIVKSSMDEYSFGPSRDLGFSFTYEPTKTVSLDLSILNGDGYKFFQTENNLKYGLGSTFEFENGLCFRLYGEMYEHDDSKTNVDNQYVFAGFLGYRINSLSFGGEYNYLQK